MPKKSTGYRYPEQFKAEAVHLAYFSPEKSIRQLAYFNRASRITDLTQLGQASPVDRGEREGLSSEEREEFRRLRKENKILKQERETLKKPRWIQPVSATR